MSSSGDRMVDDLRRRGVGRLRLPRATTATTRGHAGSECGADRELHWEGLILDMHPFFRVLCPAASGVSRYRRERNDLDLLLLLPPSRRPLHGRLDRARDDAADAVVGAAHERAHRQQHAGGHRQADGGSMGVLGVERSVDFPASCS